MKLILLGLAGLAAGGTALAVGIVWAVTAQDDQ